LGLHHPSEESHREREADFHSTLHGHLPVKTALSLRIVKDFGISIPAHCQNEQFSIHRVIFFGTFAPNINMNHQTN
jgi:hypothetical protein